MDDAWGPASSTDSGNTREFYVSTELYISNKAAAALRKPTPRKKVEKRESSRPLSILTDDTQRKVKEKTSWLNLARSSPNGDHWRQATCKLSEEGEGCLLKVYIDETILYQSIYIHLLNHTDIRLADRSLFFRGDCLGIHCTPDQRWSAIAIAEPLYLHFFSVEMLNMWIALMRSYAVSEVYGRGQSSPDGGLYRIWRQVELTCIQGRNIGTARSLEENPTNVPTSGDSEYRSDGDSVDWDLYCEVYYNDTLSGRTVVKKSLGSPDWHESFTFSDLPPFEKLAIVVLREKKLTKPTAVGTVYITLTNFRRGEYVEGWFPLLQGGSAAASVQVGQIRLKLRVDEEIILPYTAYSRVLDVLGTRNYLDWINDFEFKLKLKHISAELVAIAVAKNKLLDSVFELADREVDGTPSSHNTLFRGNTVFTKTVELLMAWYGKAFLEASVGPTIRRLCAENVAIEVDPVRSGKGSKDIERNVDLLVYWCQETWKQIYSVRTECPNEMRRLFERIRQLVEKHYKSKVDTSESVRELPWQSVSAFCFLRFIVPAILHPHLFGLCPGLPDLPVQRSLTLIAKVIQSLANLNATVQKEQFMRGVKSFLEDSLPAMIDYILVVSSPKANSGQPSQSSTKSRIVKTVQERRSNMPALQKDAVPLLPDLLDVPRHLAIITTAVLRHSRASSAQGNLLREFSGRCSEIEQQALYRVSRLASYDARIAAASDPSDESRQDSASDSGIGQ
ncbi:Rho GTPase activation protein [Dentipellis sp. KUC8613]|nr:Rho GTPase activation protein [Dentipellis sp. KUC8613]